MSGEPIDQELLHRLHAYKLGCIPITLERQARWQWSMAYVDEEIFISSRCIEDGPPCPEDASPLPVELARYLEEIRLRAEQMVDRLPRRSSRNILDRLVKDSERAWQAFEDAWLGPAHRARICERENADGGADMLLGSPFQDESWAAFRQSTADFGRSLQNSLREWFFLGAELAAVEFTVPPGWRQEPLPGHVSPAPFSTARELLEGLRRTEGILGSLQVPEARGWLADIKLAAELHAQILGLLKDKDEIREVRKKIWVHAKEAIEYAASQGWTLMPDWISKKSRKSPPPFECLQINPRRLDVELISLFGYLSTCSRGPGGRPTDADEVQLLEIPKSANQMRAERDEERERAKHLVETDLAQGARRKPPATG